MRFGQHAAFGSVFPSVRRVGAGFFPRPMELLSWLHPWIATTSPIHANRRNVAIPSARTLETVLRPSIPESGDRLRNTYKSPSHPTHSTDSLFATQSKRSRIHMAMKCSKVYRGDRSAGSEGG